jgi:hypothetical protein
MAIVTVRLVRRLIVLVNRIRPCSWVDIGCDINSLHISR